LGKKGGEVSERVVRGAFIKSDFKFKVMTSSLRIKDLEQRRVDLFINGGGTRGQRLVKNAFLVPEARLGLELHPEPKNGPEKNGKEKMKNI